MNQRTIPKIIGSGFILSVLFVNVHTLGFLSLRGIESSLFKILIWGGDAMLVWIGIYFLRASQQQVQKIISNFSVFCLSTFISLVLLEVIVRIIMPAPIFHPSLRMIPYRRILIKAAEKGAPPVYYTTNKWGMRGDPIPKDWDKRTTLVAIGGSTTRCAALGDEETWPALLQKRLREKDPEILVQNAGVSGHSTNAHVLMMDEVMTRIKPDMVIFLIGVNDLQLNLMDRHQDSGWLFKLFGTSQAYQLAYMAVKYQTNQIPALVPNLKWRKLTLNEIAGPLPKEDPLPDDLTELIGSLDLFVKNVNRLIDQAKQQNIDVLFLTQPLLYDDTDFWKSKQGEPYWFRDTPIQLSAATYWKLLRILNHKTVEICRIRGVPVLDLASVIPHETKYFMDTMHFSVEGARLVAERIYKFMAENDLPIKDS